MDDFNSSTYFISVVDNTGNTVTTFKMSVKSDGSTLKDSVYDKLSGGIDYAISAVINAGNMELQFTNNELNDLSVTYGRLAF